MADIQRNKNKILTFCPGALVMRWGQILLLAVAATGPRIAAADDNLLPAPAPVVMPPAATCFDLASSPTEYPEYQSSMIPFAFETKFAFAFLQPTWTGSRDLVAAFPTADPNVRAVMGDTRNTFNDVRFPSGISFGATLEPKDSPWAVKASGDLIQMNGSLDRIFVNNGVTNSAQATANIKIAMFALPELSVNTYDPPALALFQSNAVRLALPKYYGESAERWRFFTTIGAAQLSIHQDYSSTLKGDTTIISSGDQNFLGLGATASRQTYYQTAIVTPDKLNGFRSLWLFSSLRGSIFAGTTTRNAISDVAGNPTLKDTRTDFVPFAEVQAGVYFGPSIKPKPIKYGDGEIPNPYDPNLFVQFAFVAQYWGNMGLLGAANPGAGTFRRSDLFTFGGYLVIGVAK